MTTDRDAETGARFARWGLAQKASKHRQRVQNNISHIIEIHLTSTRSLGAKNETFLLLVVEKLTAKRFSHIF